MNVSRETYWKKGNFISMKKRIFAVITICALVLTFASCKKEPITDTQQDKTPIVDSQENQNVEELPEPEYTIKTDPLTDTVSVKDTGELLFTKTVERVRITAQHTAYIDAAKGRDKKQVSVYPTK